MKEGEKKIRTRQKSAATGLHKKNQGTMSGNCELPIMTVQVLLLPLHMYSTWRLKRIEKDPWGPALRTDGCTSPSFPPIVSTRASLT